MDNALEGNEGGLKWLMLSGHDANLGYILPALNISNTQCNADL